MPLFYLTALLLSAWPALSIAVSNTGFDCRGKMKFEYHESNTAVLWVNDTTNLALRCDTVNRVRPGGKCWNERGWIVEFREERIALLRGNYFGSPVVEVYSDCPPRYFNP
jgi:hypothetical protein